MPAPASAPPTRAVSDVVRATPMAVVSSWVADVAGDQGQAHAEVRGADEADRAREHEHERRGERAGQRDGHEGRGQRGIDGAHAAQQVAMADPVAHDAEHRRHQGARELQGAEQRQQQHRARLGQHVPAEDQRLHLEGAGGEQVGRPLEAKAAVAEERERREPDEPGSSCAPNVRHAVRHGVSPFALSRPQLSCVPPSCVTRRAGRRGRDCAENEAIGPARQPSPRPR